MPIRKELLDELLKECAGPEDMIGPDGLLKKLTGALVERMLEAEMTDHLGYERGDPVGNGSGNSRNGTTPKKLHTEIGTLDLETERFSWAQKGPWLGQHDPDLLPNGNILLFDNFGHYGPGGASRILEFDPVSLEIVWRYDGTDEQPFWTNVRGAQQRLPNGNTLITESESGRLVEVTASGEIVWEFVNPVTGRPSPDGTDLVSIVCWGQRIDPTSLDPSFRALIEQPGGIT